MPTLGPVTMVKMRLSIYTSCVRSPAALICRAFSRKQPTFITAHCRSGSTSVTVRLQLVQTLEELTENLPLCGPEHPCRPRQSTRRSPRRRTRTHHDAIPSQLDPTWNGPTDAHEWDASMLTDMKPQSLKT